MLRWRSRGSYDPAKPRSTCARMNGELLCWRHTQLSLGSLYRRSPPFNMIDAVIAQKRQCFLHDEQHAANIDIECGVETFGRDCSERLHAIADTRTREDDVDVFLLRELFSHL